MLTENPDINIVVLFYLGSVSVSLHFRATFDRSPDKLAFYLNRVWAYIDRYRDGNLTNQEMFSTITDNLEDEAAEWVTQLHNEGAQELENIDYFLQRKGSIKRFVTN